MAPGTAALVIVPGTPEGRARADGGVEPRLAVHVRAAVCLLGRFPALAGCDLDVRRGEVVALGGPNGAGKTTLLRALAGLVPVVEGTAVVLGHDVRADRRAVRRHVGLVGHDGGLYDDLTVRENAGFWLRASGGTLGGLPSALDRLGLGGRLAGLPAGRLSAGQRRRAALAVLLARDPDLWLLDEPHAGLDPDGRDLLDALVAEATARGRTVVLATHDVERAGSLADRFVALAGGATRSAEGAAHVA